MTINRRELIAGVSATAILVTTTPAAMAEAAKAVHVKPLPAWEVGTPGEMNWQVFFCETADQALEEFKDFEGFDDDDELPELVARRNPAFDDPLNREPTDADRFQAGWTTFCDRCGNEVQKDDGESEVIHDVPVCTDCMTIAEWEIRDPERAAEMREDDETEALT